MHTDRAITRMSSDQVAMRPIVDRMKDACENITFPCGRYIYYIRGFHERAILASMPILYSKKFVGFFNHFDHIILVNMELDIKG